MTPMNTSRSQYTYVLFHMTYFFFLLQVEYKNIYKSIHIDITKLTTITLITNYKEKLHYTTLHYSRRTTELIQLK